MTKHIADQPRDREEGKRLREFSKIDRLTRDEGESAKGKAMQRANRAPNGDRRTSEYLGIDRGKQV